MRITFVHTASLLNLRGSEYWLMDVAPLLKNSASSVQVVNFELGRRYRNTKEEILRRRAMIGDAFKDIPLFRLRALSLRLPLNGSWAGKTLIDFVNSYLHFLPSPSLLKFLRSSDIIYFLNSQRNPAHLIVVFAYSLLAGRRRAVVGVHVLPKTNSFTFVLLRIFVKLGILRGFHEINRSHESELKKFGCRIEYIPNGIYCEEFASTNEEKLSQDNFMIFFAGAMTDVKGVDLIPAIYDALKTHGVAFTLVICTPGGELIEMVKHWSENKGDIVFKGLVEKSELISLFARASVALFPSRREAFPLVCLEAQASGTPVVATDALAFRQVILDGRTGFLVSPYTPASFAEKINRVFDLWKNDKPKYIEMCDQARENVRTNFQWKNIAPKFVKFFREVS